MRRADIPPAERAEVYRLIFFAWADGGLDWDNEKVMRRYAREMGCHWRRFSRALEYYKRLCPPDSEARLPVFLLRNLKQSLPEISADAGPTFPKVSPRFERSFDKVSPQFRDSLNEVSPQFDDSLDTVSTPFPVENAPKSFSCDPVENTCQSHSHVHSQRSEAEAEGDAGDSGAPFDNFADPQTEMAEAVSTAIGIIPLPEGKEALPIHEAAAEFVGAGVAPSDVAEYERDFYQRKAAQGSRYPLTLKILREDIRGWVRAKRMREAVGPSPPPADNSRSAQRERASAEARRILGIPDDPLTI